MLVFFFFFQAEDGIRDVAVTGVQTCALPICHDHLKYYRLKRALEELDDGFFNALARTVNRIPQDQRTLGRIFRRSEEHTSELQSRLHLVCRLLLEKKKNTT